jgi:hypothetical protein
MLVKLTVESASFSKDLVGSIIFKTELLNGAKTVETTKTEFKYSFPKKNLFSLPQIIKVTEGIATIKTAFAATWNANYIDFPVFIDNNPSNSTETKTFSKESLLWAIAKDTNTSWVYAIVTGKVVNKYLVNYNLDQIVDVADTGATTTTTTTTTAA